MCAQSGTHSDQANSAWPLSSALCMQMTHTNWHNEEFMKAKHSEVVRIASALKDDKIEFLEGVRALRALQFDVTRKDHDPDFMPFEGVYSETDCIPEGLLRQRCSPSFLDTCNSDLEKIKETFNKQIKEACDRLITRFSENA